MTKNLFYILTVPTRITDDRDQTRVSPVQKYVSPKLAVLGQKVHNSSTLQSMPFDTEKKLVD